MADAGRLRIGELSRRTGISPELLRAWESRYDVVEPERTPGGLRLYSAEDERRVREMRRQIDDGLSAAEAAAVVLRPNATPEPADRLLERLDDALSGLDEPAAQMALDQAFGALGLEAAIARVVLPLLHDLGARWATGERSVAQEHFASHVVNTKLRALARGWGEGAGRLALLASPPGERHELGLLCFGLLLREQGWAIAYLGAETPTAELESAAAEFSPALVVLAATDAQRFHDAADGLRALSAQVPVAIGGAGASEALADSIGARFLAVDMPAAARAASRA